MIRLTIKVFDVPLFVSTPKVNFKKPTVHLKI